MDSIDVQAALAVESGGLIKPHPRPPTLRGLRRYFYQSTRFFRTMTGLVDVHSLAARATCMRIRKCLLSFHQCALVSVSSRHRSRPVATTVGLAAAHPLR